MMSCVLDQRLSQAVIAFVGVPGGLDPRSSLERLDEAVSDATPDLVSHVESILDQLYAEPTLQGAPTVSEMGQQVRTWLGPGIPN